MAVYMRQPMKSVDPRIFPPRQPEPGHAA